MDVCNDACGKQSANDSIISTAMTSDSALERPWRVVGPCLPAAEALCPAAQLSRHAADDSARQGRGFQGGMQA
jgi:hypothetical protein